MTTETQAGNKLQDLSILDSVVRYQLSLKCNGLALMMCLTGQSIQTSQSMPGLPPPGADVWNRIAGMTDGGYPATSLDPVALSMYVSTHAATGMLMAQMQLWMLSSRHQVQTLLFPSPLSIRSPLSTHRTTRLAAAHMGSLRVQADVTRIRQTLRLRCRHHLRLTDQSLRILPDLLLPIPD